MINTKLMPKNKGFTLIELLVAMTIVAILSIIGLSSYLGVQSRARDSQRLDDAKKLVTALEQFKSGSGGYPVGATTNFTTTNSTVGNTTALPWIPLLDTTNFRGNILPVDPKNTGRLVYYYRSSTTTTTVNGIITSTDYCLQIPQENDATGHPYYSGRWGTGGGVAATGDPWQLRFGPSGPSTGLCAPANLLQTSP